MIRFRQMALVDQSKAARLAGVTRQTISRKIKSGELSASQGKVDTSELIRVYGAIRDDAHLSNTILQPDAAIQSELQAKIDTLQYRLAVTKEQLVTTGKDRNMWRYIAKTATENVKLITNQSRQDTKPDTSPTVLVAISVTLCVLFIALILVIR
jgi:hypothetical protein